MTDATTNSLSFDLHALTARLDRSADRILRAEFGITYRRFRALLSVHMLSADQARPVTQRAVAEELGVSEPSLSRMATVLAEAELLDVHHESGTGNRRSLRLTPAGQTAVAQGQALLDDRFIELVRSSGVSYKQYARSTRKLLDALGTSAPPKSQR